MGRREGERERERGGREREREREREMERERQMVGPGRSECKRVHVPATGKMHRRDRSPETVARVATLKEKFQIRPAV